MCQTSNLSFPTFSTAGAVFLSFSQRPYPDSVDLRSCTGRICRYLKDKGCNPWMDAEDLQSGDSFSITAYKTLDECKAVVPIVTRGYAQSLWRMRELYYATSKASTRIFPVVIEDGWEKGKAGKWLTVTLKQSQMHVLTNPTDKLQVEAVALRIVKVNRFSS